jgi:hypothetical protein
MERYNVSITLSSYSGAKARMFSATAQREFDPMFNTLDELLAECHGEAHDALMRKLDFPVWQPGDVISMRFTNSTKPYHFVRGNSVWPGERRDLTDDEVDKHWYAGRVTVVARSSDEVPV